MLNYSDLKSFSDRFAPENWSRLTPDQRLDSLTTASNFYAIELGFDKDMPDLDLSTPGDASWAATCGEFNPNFNQITINEKIASQGSMSGIIGPTSGYEALETALHETYHSYQDYLIRNPDKCPQNLQGAREEWIQNRKPGEYCNGETIPKDLGLENTRQEADVLYRGQSLENSTYLQSQNETARLLSSDLSPEYRNSLNAYLGAKAAEQDELNYSRDYYDEAFLDREESRAAARQQNDEKYHAIPRGQASGQSPYNRSTGDEKANPDQNDQKTEKPAEELNKDRNEAADQDPDETEDQQLDETEDQDLDGTEEQDESMDGLFEEDAPDEDQLENQDESMDNLSEEDSPEEDQDQNQDQSEDQDQDESMDGLSNDNQDEDQNQDHGEDQDQDESMDGLSNDDQDEEQDHGQDEDQNQDESMDGLSNDSSQDEQNEPEEEEPSQDQEADQSESGEDNSDSEDQSYGM